VYGKFFENALLSGLINCNLKDQIQTVTANTDETLLQKHWHEVEYHLEVCSETNGAHIELL
jgi:hypothetical protein